MRIALILAGLSLVTCQGVEQVHLFEYASGCMLVSWATQTSVLSSEVVSFGTTPSLGNTVTGSSFVLTKNMTTALRLHDAQLTNLAGNNQLYYFKIGDDTTVFNFTSGASRPGGKMYLVLADLGVANDVALAPMIEATAAGAFDAVLHSGDFAYDLEDDGGNNGNVYMNGVQPIASRLSYTVGPGNHEVRIGGATSYCILPSRWAGVANTAGASSLSNTSLYYSYDDGLVHFIVIDTEQDYYDPSNVATQYSWLEADLAAVDRSVTPWLIVLGHKGYWMKKTNWTTYSALFHTYGVDIFLGGHQHNYNRLYPVGAKGVPHPECVQNGTVPIYTPCSNRTITIITGSPGCSGGIDTTDAPPAAVAAAINAYGYGRLQIVNATTAHYWWLETVASDGRGGLVRVQESDAQTDEAWIIRA